MLSSVQSLWAESKTEKYHFAVLLFLIIHLIVRQETGDKNVHLTQTRDIADTWYEFHMNGSQVRPITQFM